MALDAAKVAMGFDARAHAVCNLKLKTGKRLLTSAAEVHGLMPFIFATYEDFATNDETWKELLVHMRACALACSSYTQFIFVLSERNVPDLVECLVDVVRLILPAHQSVYSKTACPSCGKKTLYELAVQTRSFDEDATIVRRCTNCDLV